MRVNPLKGVEFLLFWLHNGQCSYLWRQKMSKSNDVVKQIRRATRRKFSADERIRIVLEGLRGEIAISELCRREGIAASVYYKWSKAFLQAGKNGLTKDTLRNATTDQVKRLRQENEQLKQSLADAILETQRYKKSFGL